MREEEILEKRESLARREEERLYEEESLLQKQKSLLEDGIDYYRKMEGLLIGQEDLFAKQVRFYENQNEQRQMNAIYEMNQMLTNFKFSYMKGEISIEQLDELFVDALNGIHFANISPQYNETIDVILKLHGDFVDSERAKQK